MKFTRFCFVLLFALPVGTHTHTHRDTDRGRERACDRHTHAY